MDTAVSIIGDKLDHAKRLVVKVGSALLVDDNRGLREQWLASLTQDLAALAKNGCAVVIVSSGAIALGRGKLKLEAPRRRLAQAQAAAAVGQITLAHAYEAAFAQQQLTAAQMLLTLSDLEGRRSYLNARETLETLLRLGAIPVINENDSTATEEIRFGDNDRLAARVAQMVGADLLILLSDIDGLYTTDPRLNSAAEWLSEVTAVTPEIEAMATGPDGTGVGAGGMVTKLMAAKIATEAGIPMAIASGRADHPIAALKNNARATVFHAARSRQSARKLWLSARQVVAGSLAIDDGAVNALIHGRSLLPAGIKRVDGAFERGDAVSILTLDGKLVGRGLAAYSAEEARKIAGVNSRDIEERLGYARAEEMVHRDDLVMETARS